MKAIIVINLPDGENPEDYEFRYALLVHKQGEYPIGKTALDVRGGNIKPLPDRVEEGYPNDEYTIGKAQGWNECLEELEGDR